MSTNQHARLCKLFLEGGFVNADANPDLFEYLESERIHIDAINKFLNDIGVQIVKTTNQRTWYPVWQRLSDATRKEVEKTATDHKKIYRHVISFFRLTLGAISHPVPHGGAILRTSTLSEIVHNNSNLIDRLKALSSRLSSAGPGSTGGDSIQSMVNYVVRWAERNGMLVEINAMHGEYRFTGKVDWINDMNSSFEECIDVPLEVDAQETLPLL